MRPFRPRRHQRGYILLATLAIVFAVSAYLLVTAFSPVSLKLAQERRTQEQNAHAKAALVGYALSGQGKVPGYLPCPDVDASSGEGSATALATSTICGPQSDSAVGRLPWRSVGAPPLYDAAGECMWYAVSGSYKNSTSKNPLVNWDTLGQFEVYASDGSTKLAGLTPDTRPVALAFAPGAAVTQSGVLQDRSQPEPEKTRACGGNYTAANYLDRVLLPGNVLFDHPARSASTPTKAMNGALASFNDQIAFYITKQDIWGAYEHRFARMEQGWTTGQPEHPLRALTRMAAECALIHAPTYTNHLPFAAPVADGFNVLSDFGNKDKYTPQTDLKVGRLPLSLVTGCLTGSDLAMWEAWKDQLFYAVAAKFAPSGDASGSCSPTDCLAIGGSRFAAIVFFSGPKLSNPTQSRAFVADRKEVGNYLEGRNNEHVRKGLSAAGNETYDSASTGGFNDIRYCVTDTLSVAPCP